MSKRAPKGQLNEQQERFCREYVISLNATKAAENAGYSAKTANEQGSRLLANASVTARIQELLKPRMKRYDITAERVLEELATLAYSDITDFTRFNESGVTMKDSDTLPKRSRRAIAEVSQVMNEYGGTVKFRLHDKKGALDSLGRYLKLFTDKVEHSGKVTLEDLVAGSQEDDE